MPNLPALLVIMDGLGWDEPGPANAVSLARTPRLDDLVARYPFTTLGASGTDVGLPPGQMGNSEVGHLNIGAGRVVMQELMRINHAVETGQIFDNPVLGPAMDAVAQSGATLHLMGLVSTGGVHSSFEHCAALVRMAARRNVRNLRVHAFLDGRDVAPGTGEGFVEELASLLANVSEQSGRLDARIGSVSGRYYAMDRDNRWDRVQRAWEAVVLGRGTELAAPVQGVRASYARGVTDEFVVPFVCDDGGVQDGDAVVFFNFRPDRARELTRAFTDPAFDGFDRGRVPRLSSFVTMTEYDPQLDVQVAFPKAAPQNVLADVLAAQGLRQLHTAETEKYAHVTFFINGGVEKPKEGEERVLVASPKVATYDLQPQMSAPEVADGLVAAIEADEADVYVVNFANPDMVGHTGVLEAAVAAVEATDEAVGRVVDAVRAKGGAALVTADHGNADCMFTVGEDGARSPMTAHTCARVPFVVVADGYRIAEGEPGRLCDVAPTLLDLVGIAKPDEWTGRSLIRRLEA
jgi:2,3-bisphosphoglycerate-independent phosphoglycerate mutase